VRARVRSQAVTWRQWRGWASGHAHGPQCCLRIMPGVWADSLLANERSQHWQKLVDLLSPKSASLTPCRSQDAWIFGIGATFTLFSFWVIWHYLG
jgi:hypothetical protein